MGITQVVYATLRGDIVVAAAASNELTAFGIPCGHTNYAAAYATGLLCARRVLKKMELDDTFKGKESLDGEEYHVEDEDGDRRPLKCILDVGIRTTCVGARMGGALKGAVDGGLHVPHSTKNFPGYKQPRRRARKLNTMPRLTSLAFSANTSKNTWKCSKKKIQPSTR